MVRGYCITRVFRVKTSCFIICLAVHPRVIHKLISLPHMVSHQTGIKYHELVNCDVLLYDYICFALFYPSTTNGRGTLLYVLNHSKLSHNWQSFHALSVMISTYNDLKGMVSSMTHESVRKTWTLMSHLTSVISFFSTVYLSNTFPNLIKPHPLKRKL